MVREKIYWATALIAAASLVACGGGGGGGGDPAPAAPAPAPPQAQNVGGLWTGTTSDGRSVAALTFQDGTLWGLYTLATDRSLIAGAILANGSVTEATINGGEGARDFSLEAGAVVPVTVTATITPKQSISGSVSANGTTTTFAGAYSSDFEVSASLAAVAGTYSGDGAVVGGVEAASVTVSPEGAMSGTSASGCTYSGTVIPRTDGNAYDVSLTFGGGVCSLGTSTTTGTAYYNSTNRELFSAALNGARTDGFLFIGTKP